MTEPRILVVGAGIAGLSCAIAFADQDVTFDIVERQPSIAPVGAGIFLPPNGIRAFRTLGIEAALMERGQVIRRLCARSADGSVSSMVEQATVFPELGISVALLRTALHEVLLGAVGVPVRLNTTVASLEQDDSSVHVTFSDGSRQEYSLVIGSDGVHSQVRRLLWPDSREAFGGESWWRTIVDGPPDLVEWTLSFCDAGTLLVMPVGNGRAYCAGGAYTSEPISDAVEGRAHRLRDRFSDVTGLPREVLDQVVDDRAVQFSPAEQVWIDHPVSGRVVLIGDACHATSPGMAQGGSMAAEDALVLADEVGQAGLDCLGGALERYVARRAPRTHYVQDATARRNRVFAQPSQARLEVAAKFGDLSLQSFRPLAPLP